MLCIPETVWAFLDAGLVCCSCVGRDATGHDRGSEYVAASKIGAFQEGLDSSLHSVREYWTGERIAASLSKKKSGRDSMRLVFLNLASLVYLRSAFGEEESKIRGLKNDLGVIKGLKGLGFDAALQITGNAFEKYYGFMVCTLEKLLSKHSYRLGFEIPKFKDIARLGPDRFERLLEALACGRHGLYDGIMKACAVTDPSGAFCTYEAGFMELVMGKWWEFDDRVRDAACEIDLLSLGMDCTRRRIRQYEEWNRRYDALAKKHGENTVDSAVAAVSGYRRCIADNVRAMQELETRRLDIERTIKERIGAIEDAIERGGRPEHGYFLDRGFFASLEDRFSMLFGEEMASNLVLPRTYTCQYLTNLVFCIKENLLAFVRHARRRAESASVKALVKGDIKFVEGFEGLELRKFHSEIVNCGDAVRKTLAIKTV